MSNPVGVKVGRPQPSLSPIPNSKRLWRLEEDHTVVLWPDTPMSWPITVPAGFETDGASVPRILHSALNPFHPQVLEAALVHDWICVESSLHKCYTMRMTGDMVFYYLLAANGVPYWKRAIMYTCVRLYGRHVHKPQWSWRTGSCV